jgi:proline iminopeptidase
MKRIIMMSIVLAAGLIVFSQENTPKSLNVPGAIFRYTVEGKGPFVLTVGGESLIRSLYTNRLRDNLTFIYADPESVPSSVADTLTMESIARDIERVRIFLGLERISVMGHSKYGFIPLEYALRYPVHAGWSILSGARPFTTSRASDLSRLYWDSLASQERKTIREENLKLLKNDTRQKTASEISFDQYKANVPMWFADPHFDISALEKAWKGSKNMAFVNRYDRVIIRSYDNSARYQEISTPVLVMSGKYDFVFPHLLWKDFGKEMPDYTFYLFDDAGHNPMLEVPDKFDQLLIDWISLHK